MQEYRLIYCISDGCRLYLAGGKGVEPLHTDSESAVLPLDEPPVWLLSPKYTTGEGLCQLIGESPGAAFNSAMACRILDSTLLRPIISMLSKSGGLIF